MHEMGTGRVGAKGLPGLIDRGLVGIEADDGELGVVREQRDRVAGPAEGGIDGDRPRLPQRWGEQLAYPVEQHGNVSGVGCTHRAPSSRVTTWPAIWTRSLVCPARSPSAPSFRSRLAPGK